MKSVRTEGCHVGLFREFVGTTCCTYGQSNTTNISSMNLVLTSVVSLRTQSEEKLPPDNISLFLLFEIELAAIISSIHPHCLVKTANSETPNTGTSKGQRDEIYIAVVLCHTDLSYGPDTSYNTDIYIILIWHAFVIMIHHPGVISHHADIITCWYVVWYHMLQYWYVNC